MKVYLSADIEGTAGVVLWDQAEKGKPDYQEAREQMTAEVAAACEGLLDGGATEVWVQDTHGTTINIIASRLPERTRLIRGWSGHPFFMLQALDETFDAVALIGYHSPRCQPCVRATSLPPATRRSVGTNSTPRRNECSSVSSSSAPGTPAA